MKTAHVHAPREFPANVERVRTTRFTPSTGRNFSPATLGVITLAAAQPRVPARAAATSEQAETEGRKKGGRCY